MCWLVILGLLMGWFPEKPLIATDIDGEPVEHDWYCPLPEPPEMYRAEPLVAEAERVVRSRR